MEYGRKEAKVRANKEMLLCCFKNEKRVRMILFLRGLDLCSIYTHTSFSFRDLPNSLVTVFILFTMDHWYALLQDTWLVPEVSRTFSSIYVILSLLLGSIIFRNIIVAMMGKHRRGEIL